MSYLWFHQKIISKLVFTCLWLTRHQKVNVKSKVTQYSGKSFSWNDKRMDFVRLQSRQVVLPVRFLNVTKENTMEMNGNSTNIYLFNCDNTCSLDPIESLLLTVQNDVKMRFAVGKRIFRLREMSDMCETIIPELQMDYAIFAVHAQESRLSINEDNAGIGFARIYRALLKATGESKRSSS